MNQATSKVIVPPFNFESATLKVRMAEDAWNSRDPHRVSLAYSEDSEWRNRDQFFQGRDQIRQFLSGKWERELDYRLTKSLWSYTDDRIAVRFQYEFQNANGLWFRSYGNELWEFDAEGLMRRREASINDIPIAEGERRFRWHITRPETIRRHRDRHVTMTTADADLLPRNMSGDSPPELNPTQAVRVSTLHSVERGSVDDRIVCVSSPCRIVQTGLRKTKVKSPVLQGRIAAGERFETRRH